MALQTAKLEAVTPEVATDRAATAQAQVRSSMSLVDTKLLTKPNVYSGEHVGKERWSKWAFKMRAYSAAMALKLGELMGRQASKKWRSGKTR